MAKATITSEGTGKNAVSYRKVYEAISVLREMNPTAPITRGTVEGLIGEEFDDPHTIGRAICTLTNATPPILEAVRTDGSRFSHITDLKIVGPLPKVFTYESRTTGERKSKHAAKPAKPAPTPAAPVVSCLADILAALPNLTRRELLVLSVQVAEQRKETQA